MEQKVSTLAHCVSAYLKARKLDGYSDKTLYSYKLHLKCLASSLGDGVPVDTMTQLYVNLSGESRQMLYRRHFPQ